MSDVSPPSSSNSPGANPAAQRSIFRAVLANASIMLGGKTVNAILALGVLALAARTLGLHEFGLLVVIYAYAETLSDIANFQSWQAVLHYGTKPLAERNLPLLHRMLRFTLMLDGLSAVAGTLVAMALVGFAGPRLGVPAEAAGMVMLYLTTIIFMSYATPSGVLRLLNRFDVIALQTSVASFVRLIGAGILFLTGGNFTEFLIVWYLGDLAAFLYLYARAFMLMKQQGLLQGFRWRDGERLTEGLPGIWFFSWTTNLNMTLLLAFSHVGTLMVGFFLGPAQAALYRVAQQVGNAVAKPAKLATPVLYPELARLWSTGSHHDLYGVALRVALAAGGVAFALLGIVALAGQYILAVIMGPEFVAAAPLMVWLVAAAAIGILALPLEPLLISTGRPAVALSIRAIVTLVYLPVLAFALTHAGLMGAGYASVTATLVLVAIQLIAVLRLRKETVPQPHP